MGGKLLYDAGCGFCTRCAGWIGERVSEIEVVPMQSVDLDVAGVDRERATREIPLLWEDGSISWGSGGIAESLAFAKMPWRLVGVVLRTDAVQVAVRRVYGLVSRNRHRLPGGTQACALPTTSLPDRPVR